jgi:hypothetical protein
MIGCFSTVDLFFCSVTLTDCLYFLVVAVCHHGGAGTTAAGLRAGKPTIIVPFFGDQFFWGSMISKSGAGPAPMSGKTVTAKQLAAAFEFVHDPKTQTAALKISTDFQHENGCEVAVRLFHTHLPLDKMRSDLESSFVACFQLNEYDLQISRPVAQVLFAAGAIEEFELSSHATDGWDSLTHDNGFKGFTRGLRRAVSKIADSVNLLKRSTSLSTIDRDTSRTTKNNSRHQNVDIGGPFKDCLPLYGEVKEKPEDEQNEDLKTEMKTKHNVHYGLAASVEKPSINNDRHSSAAACSSPAVNLPPKNIAKSRTDNKDDEQINETTNRSSISRKNSVSSVSEDDNDNKSPEQKAADLSGLSIDVCKQILSDFNQIKHDRHHSNDNERPIHRHKIPHSLHRQRSQSTDAH